MENTILKAKTPYLRDRGVITLTAGKIAYQNPKRKVNEATIEFGFRDLCPETQEPYFSVVGAIYNHIHTDCVTCGAGVHEYIQEYIHDPLLEEIIAIGKKWHLTSRSRIPANVVKRVEEIIAAFLDEYKREHPTEG